MEMESHEKTVRQSSLVEWTFPAPCQRDYHSQAQFSVFESHVDIFGECSFTTCGIPSSNGERRAPLRLSALPRASVGVSDRSLSQTSYNLHVRNGNCLCSRAEL